MWFEYDNTDKHIHDFRGDMGFLSNFSNDNVMWEDLVYPHLENAFQAAKLVSDSGNQNVTNKLRIDAGFLNVSASKAKHIGRRVSLRCDWDYVKDGIMLMLLRAKFGQHEDLAKKLLTTGDLPLMEGNTWHDNHFGACICMRCRDKPTDNVLGSLLMVVRNDIQEEAKYKETVGMK